MKESSANRQRYLGFGGEKIDNLRELTEKVCTKQHGGDDISSRVTFQGPEVRKPLLAVSGEIDKGNIVVFKTSGSLKIATPMCWCGFREEGCHRVQGRIPLHAQHGVFVLRTWEPEQDSSTNFRRLGAP